MVSERTLKSIHNDFVDIARPKNVEIVTSADGSKLWVNVDDVCVLRICQIPDDIIRTHFEHKGE